MQDLDTICLEPNNMYGAERIRQLKLHRDKGLIDLHPFFEDFFETRDKWFGLPDGYDRIEENGNIITYNFTFIEFFETFLATFAPEEFADFLEKHMTKETLQSEALISRVRHFRKDYKQAFIFWWGDPYSDRYSNSHICPVNFPVSEAEEKIPKSYFSQAMGFMPMSVGVNGFASDLREKTFPASRPIKKRNKIELMQELRARFLSDETDPIILLKYHTHFNSLDYFKIIQHYELPTDHLQIIRKQ